jgi:uncharacterized protein
VNGDGGKLPWRIAGRPLKRLGAECVIVRFRLTPKSAKDSIDGLLTTAEGPAFKARVRAVPVDGAANAALERLVAEWLDVPKPAVTLAGGAKSRVKTVSIGGNARDLDAKLQAKLDGACKELSSRPAGSCNA